MTTSRDNIPLGFAEMTFRLDPYASSQNKADLRRGKEGQLKAGEKFVGKNPRGEQRELRAQTPAEFDRLKLYLGSR
jgi:hypothetical protein